MPITYNVGNNIITVTGYTVGVPCNFTDLWNADKAGTLSLHARAGISGVDGAAVAVTNALRPADYVVLGNASADLYITITNWNLMTNATIQITGTDRDGVAQTDDVIVNANGNFSTAKWFKTVTHTQVIVFNTPGGGSFDYDLTQGQWGVIWKQGDTQFRLDCRLIIGDGTATWFADEKKQILFQDPVTADWRNIIYITNNAELRLGNLEDAVDRTTSSGCVLQVMTTYYTNVTHSAAGGVVLLYGTLVMSSSPYANLYNLRDGSRIWDVVMTGKVRLASVAGGDFYNNTYQKGDTGPSNIAGGTFENILVTDMVFDAIQSSMAGLTFRNITAYNCRGIIYVYTNIGPRILVDCATDLWHISFALEGPVYRQYSFDLKVVDSDGVGIPNVSVSIDDRLGTNVFSVNTDANGDIATQTVSYGYYDQANGDTIQPAGGGYSPHTLIMSKPGYSTRTIVYTMDRKREEIEKLGGAAPHGMEYRRRRVPGEVSALTEFE